MFKKMLCAVAMFVATVSVAFAQIDVNKADQAALESIKGVGPAISKAILDERKKGEFKDWADFQKRVSGIKDKKAAALSEAGLTVNGQAMSGSAATASAKEEKKSKASASASASASDKKK